MTLLVHAYLIEKYGLRLTLDDLAQELDMAAGTIRNQISEDRFPIDTYLDQGRRFADYRDVAEYLDRLREQARVARRRQARASSAA